MLGDSAVLGTGGGSSGDGGAYHDGGETAIGGGGSISGDDERGGGSRNEEGVDRSFGGNRWPRQETLALLKIRSDMDVAFRDASVKGPLWDEVSRLVNFFYNFSIFFFFIISDILNLLQCHLHKSAKKNFKFFFFNFIKLTSLSP
jgi:hypothetical protein